MMPVQLISLIVLATIVAAMGAGFAAAPWFARQSECFVVSVPKEALGDARLQAMKRSYTKSMTCATVLLLTCAAAALVIGGDAVALIALLAAMNVLALVCCTLLFRYRKRTRDLKKREGWTTGPTLKVAMIAERDLPKPVPLTWEALQVVVIGLTLAIGLLGFFTGTPALVPTHLGFDGVVDAWSEGGLRPLLFPVAMQVFTAVVITLMHAGTLRVRKRLDPDAPAFSAFAHAQFVRLMSLFCLVTGLVMNASLIGTELAALGLVTLESSVAVVMLALLIVVVATVALTFLYGEDGARTATAVPASGKALCDDDRCWRGGIIYFNPDDPNITVPKRFGFGVTVNMARPSVWAAILVIVLMIIAISVLF